MNDRRNATIGLADIFLVVFIVLKLTHLIDWSWWWVLSPLWISFILELVVILLYYFND